MTRLLTKKGVQGIFSRTSAPKLLILTPTEKAKNKAKIRENMRRGCAVIILKNL
jgi:hypothetical protein